MRGAALKFLQGELASKRRGVTREVSPRAHRSARIIGADALRIVLISREPSDGQERNQNNKDNPNINAHQSMSLRQRGLAKRPDPADAADGPGASPAGPLPSAAWAAARRAMGTRNGEHET